MEHRVIAFIGAGNMARSIISGLLKSGYPASSIIATNRTTEKNTLLTDTFGIEATPDVKTAIKKADVVVLGVKPQGMEDLLSSVSDLSFDGKLVISIAAGITVSRLNDMVGQTLNLVRTMPNTPSLVGLGMTGLYAPANVSEKDRDYAGDLLSATGKICWVDEESDINSIIAAAGSAPAYFFLFMEAMEAEARRMGFEADMARTLVQQSALGAAQMVVANPETTLETLRSQVTSKGGTTAEAIKVFNDKQLSETVSEAMKAAVNRAKEMESLF
ncbi:pyrroline-5-carboxylate reductase [Veronia nyctiphanis]|uniref:Pyrroline-5-carboxylate reductase n=1 Tax=Veronia nyctiphanis TaxID=1278244 RepID=A0A4Q0YTG2_9GAMM|nr:pyrroline-5-carboxylate reductase [Veronia nyctiphanis]RXJ72291.1 pyrroline-5-carboxylate reductase [Veronia nyctiphanis]